MPPADDVPSQPVTPQIAMPEEQPSPPQPLSAAQLRTIDAICDRFEQACSAGDARLEPYLGEAPPGGRRALLVELAAVALLHRRPQGDAFQGWPELLAAQGEIAEELQLCRADVEAALVGEEADDTLLAGQSGRRAQLGTPSAASLVDPAPVVRQLPRGLHVRCPHCCHPVELVADSPHDDVTCRECGSAFNLVGGDELEDANRKPLKVGRFELASRLGMGGFGTVWKARDPDLDRFVALKIPRRGQLHDEEVELFFREARAAAQLRHPNIVPVYEIGRADDEIYIVSDFVRGATLADWMKAERRTIREAAAMGATIAEALHFAHEHGIVHRDLKPSNVMVDEQGAPQIMDFGLAKRETGEATMTLDGQIIGTAAYMSPEQAAGEGHWTDRRSDVYSLGVVLFQMATGELPFRGNFDAQLTSKLRDDPPNPRSLNPRVPRDLATICLKCLERNPQGRYATAQQVAAELRRLLAGEPILARPVGAGQRAWRWAKRRPAAAIALTLAGALAVAGPLAAVTIERQRRAVVAKTAELYELVATEQAAKRRLGEKIAALQRDLDAVSGQGESAARTAGSWRRALIAEIVDRNAADTTEAMGESAEDAALRNLAAGMLLAEIGRNVEAIARLQAAREALASLAESLPDDERYQLALADCAEQLAAVRREAGEIEQSQQDADAALALRTVRAQQNPHSALHAVDLLAAHYGALPSGSRTGEIVASLGAVPKLTQQILDNWPADAAARYEAACRLTLRTPLLSSSTSNAPRSQPRRRRASPGRGER